MKPKRQKLASLAQKNALSSFSSMVHSLLPKDTLLSTYLSVCVSIHFLFLIYLLYES